eukprot:scaffold19634_cov96-Amphora_coffeaeformis.AAC.1
MEGSGDGFGCGVAGVVAGGVEVGGSDGKVVGWGQGRERGGCWQRKEEVMGSALGWDKGCGEEKAEGRDSDGVGFSKPSRASGSVLREESRVEGSGAGFEG